MRTCQEAAIITLVAYRDHVERGPGPTPPYYSDKFSYNKEKDAYTCPQGQELTTNGRYYVKYRKKQSYRFKRYLTNACQTCPVKALCTQRKYGRNIDRTEFQDAIEENNYRVDQQLKLYQQRQALVEHPFGTMKRGWGYSYTLLKGLKKVNGEMALIFLCYNLRRTLSIVGLQELVDQLKKQKLATLRACWRKIRRTGCFYRLSLQARVENDFSTAAA